MKGPLPSSSTPHMGKSLLSYPLPAAFFLQVPDSHAIQRVLLRLHQALLDLSLCGFAAQGACLAVTWRRSAAADVPDSKMDAAYLWGLYGGSVSESRACVDVCINVHAKERKKGRERKERIEVRRAAFRATISQMVCVP